MPLLTYEQVRPWAKSIRQQTALGKMPPWFAARASAQFENEARLSAGEKAAIQAWVEAGAPPGSPSAALPPSAFPDGWNIGEPDLVVEMPKPVRVPARTEMDYQFIVLPLKFDCDRWIQAVEVRPGARRVVHHAVVYVREPGSRWLRGDNRRVTTSDILAVYAPGQPPVQLRTGMAKKIPAGSDLILQMHYTPAGEAMEDRTRVGMIFATREPERRVFTLQMGATDFRIPPGERNHRVSVSGTMPADALLLSLFPHLHLRGKAFAFERIAPGGVVETLLEVRPYDFFWQLNYRLSAPRLLPKGTMLRFTAWYDNSPNNPLNPDPTAEVVYGEQSKDEMMVGFFDVAVDPRLDKEAFFQLRNRI